MNFEKEKNKQQLYQWHRGHFSEYNNILGEYQAKSVLENAKGDSLLDLACGDGILTQKFCGFFKRVVGVDASKKQLARAKQNCSGAEFHESLIENFETGERFDTVVMLNILEHVENSVYTLKKAASFLKSKGNLIVHVPNALAVNRVIARLMGTLKNEYELSPYDVKVAGHRRSYDMPSFIKDIKKAGLRPIRTGGIFYKILSTAQMDWFLKHGLWQTGEFGWGRVGEREKDWKREFCRACYEYGKLKPEECNIIYACIKK